MGLDTHTNNTYTMQTFELITNTIAGAIDFADDTLEGAFRETFAAGGKAMISALAIEAAKTDADDVADQIEGLVDLAKTYAGTDLSTDQANGLKKAIAKIVRIPTNLPLESALEDTFNNVLDGVGAALVLNEVADNYNPPDETGN